MEYPINSESIDFKIGKRKIVLKRIDEGLWLYRLYDNSNPVAEKVVVANLMGGKLEIVPDYLDKPIFLKLKEPLKVPPKTKFELFLKIPLQFEVKVHTKAEYSFLLDYIMPFSLKTAWYGEMEQGEFAYFYETEIIKNPNEDKVEPFTVLLPVEIVNESDNETIIEKLLIDSYQLSLYQVDNLHFTEVVKVVFKKGPGEVVYTDKKPMKKAVEIRKGIENVKKKGLFRINSRKLKKLKRERLF